MTTARDVIDSVLGPSEGEMGYALSDEILAALAAAEFVVVACPHGGRVVVSRESKPCPECDGIANRWRIPCASCGGSGVVEATTIHGLEATSTDRDGVLCDELGRVLTDQTVPLFRAVALPEDGQ